MIPYQLRCTARLGYHTHKNVTLGAMDVEHLLFNQSQTSRKRVLLCTWSAQGVS